ncbi:multiheme c-type cytochrome [Isosphaeraceae bacterium EP7]
MATTTTQPAARDRRGRAYIPAVGPRQRPWLWMVLGGFALLGANGVYLASVTAMTWLKGATQATSFYMLMVGLHIALGLALIVPFVVFGLVHLATSWKRPNKAAVVYGLILLAASIGILISGIVLVRIGWFEVRNPAVREAGYWLHVGLPLLAIALYVKHRLAGPMIRWYWARRLGLAVGLGVAAMAFLHTSDPNVLTARQNKEGKKYFRPSSAITSNGQYIPAQALMMDQYCLKCHKDAYDSWFHSSHHFSSFNNKAYMASVRETRQVSLERDGNTRAARWCAGCHDPVPFFSGEFDDPNYDDVNTPSSQAGITCTACHSITHVASTRGNADYRIEEPTHYPFAYSENPVLQWINNTLVKAKPELHKKTFLKPVIKDSKFCSTCHKVSLPYELNKYKDFLRGQNHWDTFALSGASGGGARSFYYPPVAKGKCIDCHMNLTSSDDFGAKDFAGTGDRSIHNHLFLGANTGLAALRGRADVAEAHAKYLKDAKVRIDLFALREGGGVEGEMLGPLRPKTPTLVPGKSYLVETVVRTVALGHPFSQGTVDSNEIWVELIARADGKVIGRSGGIDDRGQVDPYSHFINVYMLDRNGKRIDRRNPQDIFVPLYNKQIPPGAGQVVHFGLTVPEGTSGPITLEAKVNYRKFDRTYLTYLFGNEKFPELPVVVMASDSVALAVQGGPAAENKPSPIKEGWQRWNDYGIGLLLEGPDKGGSKGELLQAERAFKEVVELGKADGWVNLARVYQKEGRIPDAREALAKAAAHKEPAPPWVVAWLTGQINERNGYLDEAIANFESVLATRVPARKLDFSGDYEVINSLATALYSRSQQEKTGSPEAAAFLARSIEQSRKTLSIDSENVPAHYGLGLAYAKLGRGQATVETPIDPKTPALVESIPALAQSISKPGVDKVETLKSLRGMIGALVKGPPHESASRIDPIFETVEALATAYDREVDVAAKASLAATLSVAHRSLHGLFKPDENAEGRAIAIARRDSKAADQNAQSIVIHPMHRPGAPGIDAETKAAQADAAPAKIRGDGE